MLHTLLSQCYTRCSLNVAHAAPSMSHTLLSQCRTRCSLNVAHAALSRFLKPPISALCSLLNLYIVWTYIRPDKLLGLILGTDQCHLHLSLHQVVLLKYLLEKVDFGKIGSLESIQNYPVGKQLLHPLNNLFDYFGYKGTCLFKHYTYILTGAQWHRRNIVTHLEC